jgi:hypothetical protein
MAILISSTLLAVESPLLTVLVLFGFPPSELEEDNNPLGASLLHGTYEVRPLSIGYSRSRE